jgi:6-phosphogluconolactonase
MAYQLKKKIVLFDDALQASNAIAYYILNASLTSKNKFSIALSGGSTPKLLYQLLASPPFCNNINWSNILFFIVDERYVAHNNEESNFKMMKDVLFSKIKIPRKNIFPIHTNKTAATDALAYENTIKTTLKNRQFDLVLLGLGTDGHTASLFPNYTLLQENKRLVKEEFITEKNQYRISLTIPIINKAKQIIFLVSGKDKAPILKKITTKQNKKIPATLIQSKNQILWFITNDVVAK